MIRLFIGIRPPDEIVRVLAGLKDEIHLKKASWAPESNIHLTLKFLGYAEEERLDILTQAMEKTVCSFNRFELTLDGLGAFPSKRKARIFYAGVEGDIAYLSKMHALLDKELKDLGFKREKRKYIPHFTLARLREVEDLSPYLNKKLPSLKMEVGEVVLYQSKLSPKGATYIPLKKFELKAC